MLPSVGRPATPSLLATSLPQASMAAQGAAREARARPSTTVPAAPRAGCLLAELVCSRPLFPGASDQDQLYLILKCFGSLSEQQTAWLRAHPL
jgi:hypothetical protein